MEKPDSYIGIYLKKFRENRKAVSPVISTIIIVAVAIAIAIAVAFWLGGITSIFTRFEKLEIPTAYAEISGNNWLVHLKVKNTGAADTKITDVFLNNEPLPAGVTLNSTIPIPLATGAESSITITIPTSTVGFTAGQAITVTLHTSGGQDYPKTVVLP